MIKIEIINWKKSSTKIVIVVFVALLTLSSYFIISSYKNYLDNAQQAVLKNLEAISKTLSLHINSKEVEYLTSLLNKKPKNELKHDSILINMNLELSKVSEINNIVEPISIMYFDEKQNRFYFVANSVLNSDSIFYNDKYINYPDQFVKVYKNGGPLGPYKDEFGTWLSSLTPIKNKLGETVAAIEVDLKFDLFISKANKILFVNLFASILIFILTSIILLRYVRIVLINEEIIKSKLEESNKIIEEKNNDIIQSINYAKKIQTAILPSIDLINEYLPDSFIYYKPKDIVSGDFYYFQPTSDSSIFIIAVVDCTGHGVPGALMSMIGNDLLKHIINEKKVLFPNEILETLNEGIIDVLKQEGKFEDSKDGMDISLCLINKHEKTLYYSGANRPLIYIEDGKLTSIKPNKEAIGGTGGSKSQEKKKFQLEKVSMKNKTFYLYTDGFVDQFGGLNNKKFMTKKFHGLLESITHENMNRQSEMLNSALSAWRGNYEQTDDILVIGFKVI